MPVKDGRKKKRVTIADIAERAGVTSGAVSLAVNGKRGVSDATRTRILEVAKELNWRPSHAAQTLMGKAAEAIGLVLTRPAAVVGEEIFFAKFIAGVQSALSEHGYSLLLQMAHDTATEIAIHRAWMGDGRVDGILVLDPRVDDPRIEALVALEAPTVIVGGEVDHTHIRSLRVDNAQATRLIMEHLHSLGHQRVGLVAGDQSFWHIQRRMETFDQFCVDHGIWGQTLVGGFDANQARTVTKRLLKSPQPPTAIVFDSEVMALAGMSVIAQQGLSIPEDVSIVSWEDSTTCQVLHPTLTALDRDAVSLGRLAAAEMFSLLAHTDARPEPMRMQVVPRESTARPAGSSRY